MIDSLIGFVETGKRDNLDKYPGEALTSLRAATRETATGDESSQAQTGRKGAHALPSYEQMRTFNEVVATPERRNEIIGVLDGLLKQSGSARQQRGDAEKGDSLLL